MRDDTETIRVALRARCAEMAERLLGQPTYRGRTEHRWGRRGSLALAVAGAKAGLWYDHEAGEGGDLFDLIQRQRRSGLAEAVQFARAFLGASPDGVVPISVEKGGAALPTLSR